MTGRYSPACFLAGCRVGSALIALERTRPMVQGRGSGGNSVADAPESTTRDSHTGEATMANRNRVVRIAAERGDRREVSNAGKGCPEGILSQQQERRGVLPS